MYILKRKVTSVPRWIHILKCFIYSRMYFKIIQANSKHELHIAIGIFCLM